MSESLSVVFIYLYSRYITKKSGGEYRGFFLNKRPVNMTLIEHTIPANMDDAMGVSKLIEKELPESSLSHEIGETVERMIVNVIGMNDELEWIDIIIRDKENSVVISIKNGGLGFHEDEEYDELKSDYYTLKDITDDIEYSKILGLNNTVITIKK